jgi:arylsulfatase A-like enzyme
MPVRRVLLAALTCGALSGCQQGPSEAHAAPSSHAPPASSAPVAATKPTLPNDLNVLLVTVDALRADMPWTGYPRSVAPKLSALAKKSIVYTRAYALSSYTSMSLAGLLSGRYPSELPRNGLATSGFEAEALMFPELLDDAKVRAIGVHGHVYFLGATGINQGFDDWRVVPRITVMPAKEGAIVDDQLADIMIAALGEHQQKHAHKRFFAWVHFMDPHASYARHEGFPRFTDASDPGLGEIGQRLRNQYDAEVVFTDHQLGRLLEWLDKQPFGKKTAVVVTADHGEAFGEHKSYFEHGFLLYEETTRVPLIVHVPGLAARRIETPRSHIDLARTLIELLGAQAPASLRGKSLVPELLGEREPGREIVIDMPYTDQTPRRRALIDGRYKIIVTESSEQPELYDLETDPREQRDLAHTEPKLLERMLAVWKRVDSAAPDYPAPRRSKRQY